MSSVLYTPHGTVSLSRDEVPVPPEYLRMLAVFANTSEDLSLGLHCARCKQDLHGANTEHQGQWTMECGCRTFVGRNPMSASPRMGHA